MPLSRIPAVDSIGIFLLEQGQRAAGAALPRLAGTVRILPNLRRKLIIDGAGHWIQQERALEVNAALIAFLQENAAPTGCQ